VISSEVDARIEQFLLALFVSASATNLEREAGRNQQFISRCIAFSIKSGVLCRHSAFVRFPETSYKTNDKEEEEEAYIEPAAGFDDLVVVGSDCCCFR
jgi:hypothetical protein